MNQFWTDHWWLLIPLGAFTIPLAGILLGGVAVWLDHRSRARALDALKIYVQAGKEPPPELLRSIGDGSGDVSGKAWKWQANFDASAPGAEAGEGPEYRAGRGSRWADPDAIRARTEYYTARAAARSARWRAREPLRRWNNAIFLSVGAGALYYASQHYAYDHVLSDRLFIGAVIVGALAAAGVLAAVMATLFRPG